MGLYQVFNNDGREGVNNSIGDGGGKDRRKNKQCLGISKSLYGLLGVESLVLDTCLVASNSFDGNDAFALVEEACI